MKRLNLFIVVAVLSITFFANGVLADGDLGGRAAEKAFKLTQDEIVKLRMAGDLGGSYVLWLESLNKESSDEVTEKVFETLIIPQLEQE